MTRVCGFVLVFLQLSLCTFWGQAKLCDLILHPVPRSDYQYKERGDRCEGFYVATVGGEIKLDLVSFQFGLIDG